MKIRKKHHLVAAGLPLAFLFSTISGPSIAEGQAVVVPKSFKIFGAGWGHGLGMSQYGAHGMALDKKKADQIISHYYQGAKVSQTSTTSKLRVGLMQDKDFVAIRGEKHPDQSSGGTLTIWIDGVKQTATVPAGKTLTLNSVVEQSVPKTKLLLDGNPYGQGKIISVTWSNTSTLVNLAAGSTKENAILNLGTSACQLDACPHRYRYGQLEIKSGALANDSKVDLNVVNILRLSDHYLYGLGEMQSSWPIEALKAQVIAARSFAVIYAKSLRVKRGDSESYCDCNLDTTDGTQVFVGFSKEYASYGSKWKQAVDETVGATGTTAAEKAKNGLVVKSGSEVVAAYYSSSTGGKTQSRSEVWGTGTISWLVGVPDPWSQDPRVKNPNASWKDEISQANLVKTLNEKNIPIADVAALEIGSKYSSGGVKSLIIRDSAGNVTNIEIGPGKAITPDGLRGVLGIKSTYISEITPSSETTDGSTDASPQPLTSVDQINWPTKVITPTEYGFAGKVTPTQMGVTVKLQRFTNGKWATLKTSTTTKSGAWTIPWKAESAGTHKVRIAASNEKGSVQSPSKEIKISGKVYLKVPKVAKKNSKVTLKGHVFPRVAGVEVVIERKIGNGQWRKLKVVKTDKNGNWSTTRATGNKGSKVAYRVKVTDKQLGKVQSKVKTLTIR